MSFVPGTSDKRLSIFFMYDSMPVSESDAVKKNGRMECSVIKPQGLGLHEASLLAWYLPELFRFSLFFHNLLHTHMVITTTPIICKCSDLIFSSLFLAFSAFCFLELYWIHDISFWRFHVHQKTNQLFFFFHFWPFLAFWICFFLREIEVIRWLLTKQFVYIVLSFSNPKRWVPRPLGILKSKCLGLFHKMV